VSTDEPKPKFFATPELWRAWLEKNHTSKTELWVGYYKTSTGKKSITWPQSVDEALCFGWIDGLRKSIDDDAYKIRFTPRKKTSIWSAVNVKRIAVLTEEGRMTEAGLTAFGHRKENKTGIYGHDRKEEAKLPSEWQSRFEKNKRAWTWFSARAPSYRRIAIHWVMSAVKEETRERRFQELVRCSEQETTIGPLTRPTAKKKTKKTTSNARARLRGQ
jgi:uncharacterized protein YdeI (YjbR/CyaY-like superfamily)